MNREEREGKKENLKGRVKQAAGVLTGDKRLESEGIKQRGRGAVREDSGRTRRVVGEAIEDLGKRIKR